MIYNDDNGLHTPQTPKEPEKNPNTTYHYVNPNYHNGAQNNISYTPAQPVKPEKRKSHGFAYGAIVVALAFVVSVAGTVIGRQIDLSEDGGISSEHLSSQASSQTSSESLSSGGTFVNAAANTAEEFDVTKIAAAAADSVVEITTEQITTNGRMQQLVSTGAGSGVIISDNGYIITNNHVIADAQNITVTLRNGEQYDASLVGTDEKTDVAVIKIEATGLTAASIGSSANLNVGQNVVVIGNPLGQLGGTVTTGIISALDREISVDGTTMTLLQTDAAINQGNSGGGMFNANGQLIAVVNAKSLGTGIEGLGFAIPIDTAVTVANDLIKYGFVQGRVELGINLLEISDEISAWMYKVNNLGVYIYSVNEGSGAESAGLKSGDLILTIDGNAVSTTDDITKVLDQKSVGDSVTLTIDRSGKQGTVTIVLQQASVGKNL